MTSPRSWGCTRAAFTARSATSTRCSCRPVGLIELAAEQERPRGCMVANCVGELLPGDKDVARGLAVALSDVEDGGEADSEPRRLVRAVDTVLASLVRGRE